MYVCIFTHAHSLDHRPGAGVLEGAVPQVQLLQPRLLPTLSYHFVWLGGWVLGVEDERCLGLLFVYLPKAPTTILNTNYTPQHHLP